LSVLEKIIKIDPDAIFILDDVYVGILEKDNSVDMFKEILGNPKLLNRIIFSESLSKTLGTT
jgi:aspartate/methionine/tyrosine aminotransferase